jgi:hypothetical protein
MADTFNIYSKQNLVPGNNITLTSTTGGTVTATVVAAISNPQPIQGPNGLETRDVGRGYYTVEVKK